LTQVLLANHQKVRARPSSTKTDVFVEVGRFDRHHGIRGGLWGVDTVRRSTDGRRGTPTPATLDTCSITPLLMEPPMSRTAPHLPSALNMPPSPRGAVPAMPVAPRPAPSSSRRFSMPDTSSSTGPAPAKSSVTSTPAESAASQPMMAELNAMMAKGQSMNMEYLLLQERMQAENRAYSTASNVLKVKHDTAKAMINNLR
jgi:hypothetical protein